MIHELIDQKKRTFRCNTARSTKTVSDNNKNLTENHNFEPSDDIKGIDSSTTTFIPPWLRYSLGLNQKTNQSHAVSDQKSARTVLRYKEQGNNDYENLKPHSVQDCTLELADHSQNCLGKNCEVEISLTQDPDVTQPKCINSGKPVTTLWGNALKNSEGSLKTNLHVKPLKQEVTSTDVMTSHEIDKIRDEEKKKFRLIRQKNRLKRRATNEQKPPELEKDEVSLLLEMKAREVLHNYTKKNVHSSASDLKQLEAKLILLSAKCETADESKLGPQEVRLLQEINEQAGSKEDFNKLMEHVKETNLKEILRNPNELAKALGDKLKKFEEIVKYTKKEEKGIKEIILAPKRGEDGKNLNLEKEVAVSTDDENDIKRFSDLLSKNKNTDEKRRCLEEVRNYFEKKRRTRMTKRRTMDESKIPKSIHFGDKKDDIVRDKLKFKDISIAMNSKDKKIKLRCDGEVVEKAVNETLQKFVDLYHFHVSPSVLGTVRKNILQAIQTDPEEPTHSRKSIKYEQEDGGNADGEKSERPTTQEEEGFNDKKEDKDKDNIVDRVSSESPSNKEENKRNLTTAREDLGCQTQKSDRDSDIAENVHVERLKMEFETFLNSIQAQTDITDLKLQSVILEKEEESSTSKNLQFVYNFTKKLLDSSKPNQEFGSLILNEEKTSKVFKDAEAQISDRTDTAKRNAKTQTCSIKVFCDRILQTESISYITSVVQTDDVGMTLKELKDLKGEDVSTGLYRMIKSREKGKFYLYPESLDDPKAQKFDNKSSDSFKESHDCGTNTDTTSFMKNTTHESKISKEKTFLFKERDSKFRKIKKNTATYPTSLTKKPLGKKENLPPNFENSINCLFFRSSRSKSPESVTKSNSTMDEGTVYKGDQEKNKKEEPQGSHVGCAWFWNGEKISPGFDLKVHVEDLLAEKLKEMNGVNGPRNKSLDSDRRPIKGGRYKPRYPVENDAAEATNAEFKKMFYCEQDSNAIIDSNPLIYSGESESISDEKKADEEYSAQNVETIILDGAKNEEKRVRDIGTQNSQQAILSLNITRMKSRSRNGSMKSRKRILKSKRFTVKPIRKVRSSVIYIKKPSDVAKAVQKLKKMKLKIENVRSSGTTSSTPSVAEGSASSTTSNNSSEDPVAMLLGVRKDSEGNSTSMAVKSRINKIRKIIGSVDHEAQMNSNRGVQQDFDVKKSSVFPPEIENVKQWEFIENLLNGINQKERESIWNDIRDFIKKKVGHDIDDENAQEVCIEIEQHMPKQEGKPKHGVLARGHYIRNEGDVEVEIDLTLDDLERILRHRQKKVRRRQWSSHGKSRKLLSSSSTHSDFRKMISVSMKNTF